MALLGWLVWTVVSSPILTRFGPLVFGLLCLAILMNLICIRPLRRSNYLLCGLLFILWANLHFSFLIGIILLAAFFIGQILDTIRRTSSLSATCRNRRVKRWLVLLGFHSRVSW